jgi:ribonuclease HI
MLERLKIDKWDILLIGDGSGSNYNYACGWGCISVLRDTFEREVWYGGMSKGTVNLAEMMAYIQPLNAFVAREDERRKNGGKRRVLQVHIITDSEYVREQGSNGDLLPRRNGAMWRIFDDYTRQGFQLHWHWIPRDTVELNAFADLLSKEARKLVKECDVQRNVETVGGSVGRTVYDFNPSH